MYPHSSPRQEISSQAGGRFLPGEKQLFAENINIRRARKRDFSQVQSLAAEENLYYEGMIDDDFWVAEEDGKVVAIAGFRRHLDCLEICSVAVHSHYRGRGLGKSLLARMLEGLEGEVFLATVIPDFFKKIGFSPALHFPPSMVKGSEWCEGCQKELCTVMMRATG